MLTRVYTFKVIDGRIKADILAFATDNFDDIIESIRLNHPLVQTIVYDVDDKAVILDIPMLSQIVNF